MISIVCSGSRGDYQPYIALAQEIRELGEEVEIVGIKEFKEFVEGYGIKFNSIDMDSTEVDKQLLEDARSSDNPLKMIFTFNKMKKYGDLMVNKTFDALLNSDVIVYHPGLLVGYFIAKERGVPGVLASPFPIHKSDDYLSVITYGKAKNTKLNRLISYKILHNLFWIVSKSSIKSLWKSRFGRVPDKFTPPFERVSKDFPAVISCSNYVFKKSSNLSENIHQSGYWFTKESRDFIPPKELKEFLESGEKPIYFGFGSVFSIEERDEILDMILKSLKNSGMRGILSGMGNLENLPDNVISIGSTPHTWLFKEVRAVCHHGGAGTTAAGFKAGVPSIIIPFSNDQFAWAHRAYDLGVASKPIYRKNLSEKNLTEAIEFITQDEIKESARILGENISTESGGRDSAKLIVSLLKK